MSRYSMTPPKRERPNSSASSLESGEIRPRTWVSSPKRTRLVNTKKTNYTHQYRFDTFRLSPRHKDAYKTIYLPESRTPVLYNKYKKMILNRNSLYSAYSASTNNINETLRSKLNNVLMTALNVGRGSLGTVKKVLYSPEGALADVFAQIHQHQQNKSRPLTQLYRKPHQESIVAIKIQKIRNQHEINTLKNETLIMEDLQGLSFVPVLYATIYDAKQHTFYFFMEYIKGGQTLGNILSRPTVSIKVLEEIYRNLNTALIQMWKRGVTHMDLHRDNIIVLNSKAGKEIKIIDFGLAHKTQRVKNIAAGYRNDNNAWLRWKENLKRYANALTVKSKYSYYNPDTKILAVLHDMLTHQRRRF